MKIIKNKMKMKHIMAAALIGSISLFTGCAQSAGAPGVDVDMSPIVAAGNDLSGNDGLVIGSITMISEGEWYGEVLAGVRAAASDLGITLVERDSDGDLELEERQVREFIDDGVDAIIICPITSDRTGKLLMEAERSGIPTVTWNTVVDTDVTASVCVDSGALGGNTGNYLAEYVYTYNLSGLKMGLITNESYTIGVARCEGFKESIKGLEKDGSVTVVSEMLAETTEETEQAVGRMLSEHPDIDVIWCWNQTSLLACIDVAGAKGKSDLIIMGTDMSMSIAEDMLDGSTEILAVTTQLPYNMGYKAVVNAVQAAKGMKVDKTIVIPTFTYVKTDTDGLQQYIESHAAFAQ